MWKDVIFTAKQTVAAVMNIGGGGSRGQTITEGIIIIHEN